MIVQAAHEGELLGKPCACEADPHWWEVMEEQITEALAPGHVLTYGGTAGPDTAMDHAVVHIWHVDYVPRPFVPSTYVEPQHVADQRQAAFRDFDPSTIERPKPAPFDFVEAMGNRPVPRAWPEHDPAPMRSNREPLPEGFAIPKPVLDLRKKAQACGFEVRIGLSQSMKRKVLIGSYDALDTLGVWGMGNGWRFSAMYERKPEANNPAWKWGSVSLWRDGKFPFPYASVTDLKKWLEVRGSVLPSWFEEITVRERAKAAKQKAAAKARPSTTKEES